MFIPSLDSFWKVHLLLYNAYCVCIEYSAARFIVKISKEENIGKGNE